jgi:hypothetical protein
MSWRAGRQRNFELFSGTKMAAAGEFGAGWRHCINLIYKAILIIDNTSPMPYMRATSLLSIGQPNPVSCGIGKFIEMVLILREHLDPDDRALAVDGDGGRFD